MPRHHLLSVWNPIHGPDVMGMHLRALLAATDECKRGRCSDDDVYVWWGKVRSASRRGPLPHIGEIKAIDVEQTRDDPGPETHLYLTDYRSLYIGHVGVVTTDDVRQNEGNRVPRYYTEKSLYCDLWFRLWDIRRLVHDDTTSVVQELRKLANTRYHNRPVSIYGGMVELPLLVTENDPERYFDPETRDRYTDGAYWCVFDKQHLGLGKMESDLRKNLFGTEAWKNIGPLARSFIANGEKLYRENIEEPGFDAGAVIVEFGKALEVRCNRLLRTALQDLSVRDRSFNIEDRSSDFTEGGPCSLGQLAHLLSEEPGLRNVLSERLDYFQWFLASLPPILGQLSTLRNKAAHTGMLSRDEVTYWRNYLMGIGFDGIFARLALVTLK